MKSTASAVRRSVPGIHRSQIYLDDRLFRLLRDVAKRRRTSAAAVVREALQDYFSRQVLPDDDPFMQLGSGGTSTGIRDGSADVDRYLYRKGTRP